MKIFSSNGKNDPKTEPVLEFYLQGGFICYESLLSHLRRTERARGNIEYLIHRNIGSGLVRVYARREVTR